MKSNVCRCCLSSGCYTDASIENFEEILTKTFNLELLSSVATSICKECSQKLQDAATFKQQVMGTERILLEQTASLAEDNHLDESVIKLELKEMDALSPLWDDTIKSDSGSENVHNEILKNISTNKEITERSKTKNTSKKKEKSQNHELKNVIETTIQLISNSNVCLFRSLRRKLACFDCRETFFEIKDLRKHSKIHSKTSEIQQKVSRVRNMTFFNADITNLTCKICSGLCDNLDSLTSHLSGHNVVFKTTKNLLIPFRIEGSFTCVLCGEEFKAFLSLSIHMNKHSINNVCEICGLAYFTTRGLKNHFKNTHTEHKCVFCIKTYPKLSMLKRHQKKIHNKTYKNRYCSRCDQIFESNYSLSKHMVHKHNAAPKLPVKCTLCDKTVMHIRSHVRSVHIKERKHKCSICELSFFTNFDRVRHEKSHQEARLFSCGICDTKFKSKDSKRRHLSRQHGRTT